MSLKSETASIKRATTLLILPAMLAVSVLSSAPAQAATSTSSAGSESRTHATATASVAQPLTRAQLRAAVVAINPRMAPAEVEVVTDLLVGQAAQDFWQVARCASAIVVAVGSLAIPVSKLLKLKAFVGAVGGVKTAASLLVGATTRAEKARVIGGAIGAGAAEVLGIDAIIDNCKEPENGLP